MRPDRSARPAEVLAYLAIAALFVAIGLTWGKSKLLGDGIYWDGRVYARAIAAARAGADPYLAGDGVLPFVNPPLFLKAAVPLGAIFPGHTGWYLYLAVMIASTLAIPYLMARFYLQSDWMTPVVAMAVFTLQPRFIVEQILNSGNIANPLYVLVLLGGIPGLRHNRWRWFYLAVILAGLTKPAMLSLLLLPLLAGARQLRGSALTAATVFAGYGLQRIAMPGLYANFQTAVYRQVVVKHDDGIGLYSLFARIGEKVAPMRAALVGTAAHFVVIGLLLTVLYLFRKDCRRPLIARLWVPALVVAATLANPRMQNYDTDIAILPALFIAVECVRMAGRHRAGVRAVAFAITLALFVFTTDYSIGVCLLFLMTAALPVVMGRAGEGAYAK